MAEEKRDSFWDNKNDDFWNNPVVSEDWLKSDSDSFWKKEEPSANEAGDSTNIQQNVQYNISKQEQDVSERDASPKTVNEELLQLPEKEAKTKKKHKYTRIRLSVIGITVFMIIAFVLVAKWNIHSALKAASKFNGIETLAENKIILYDNEVMLLDYAAYTVVPELEDEVSHEKEKIVAFYVILGSDRSERKLNALQPYISYETPNGMVYKNMCNSWEASEYGLEEYGFTKEDFLYSYTGKGYDSAGFYFFVVPKNLKKIKFYVETYSHKNHSRIVENIYVKELYIEDNPNLELLHLNRKVVQ